MVWGKDPTEPTATGENVWSGTTPVATHPVTPGTPSLTPTAKARLDDIAIPPIPEDAVRVGGRTGGWANPDADD